MSLLAWGGVVALELHHAFPAVAETRAVPAALSFALALRLRPAISVPSVIGLSAWIALMASRTAEGAAAGFASIAALALPAGAAGILARKRRETPPPDEILAREAIAGSRSLVLPWEEPVPGRRSAPAEAAGEIALLRRELELSDMIGGALERLLPLLGAAHVAFLSPATAPGSARHEGLVASVGKGAPRAFSVPDTYVPVREAIVFRRPFREEGPAAGRYVPAGLATGARLSGVAAEPVFLGESVEGVLLAVREEEGGWPDYASSLLELVARFIGRDIERTRLLHQGERYLLREDWYHRMVRNMAQVGGAEGEAPESLSLRRRKVYAEAVGQLRRQVGADRVLLIGTSDGGKTGWVTWEETDSGAGGSDRPEAMEASYAGWVIRTGSRRIISGIRGGPRGQEVLPPAWAKPGEQSFLLLPVAGVGGFRGAVVCCHGEERRFNRQHAEIARDITEVMQLGLSHVGHLEMLTKRAETDGLTGLANRKSFLRRLEEELERLDGRHPLAVVMTDIDHFKRINDTYGHPFGDEVLRRVSAVLGKAVRRGDFVGRYGGEEFILFLPMADPVKAVEGADRLRRMIRQTKFSHEGKEVVVTASFGLSCAPVHGNRPEELIKKADEALYLSKQRGRDRVTLYPG
jgi:diguanylate cyclase (GGDEF)-like protein